MSNQISLNFIETEFLIYGDVILYIADNIYLSILKLIQQFKNKYSRQSLDVHIMYARIFLSRFLRNGKWFIMLTFISNYQKSECKEISNLMWVCDE